MPFEPKFHCLGDKFLCTFWSSFWSMFYVASSLGKAIFFPELIPNRQEFLKNFDAICFSLPEFWWYVSDLLVNISTKVYMAVAFLQNFWRISIQKVDGLTSNEIATKPKNYIQKNCCHQILVQITNKNNIICIFFSLSYVSPSRDLRTSLVITFLMFGKWREV